MIPVLDEKEITPEDFINAIKYFDIDGKGIERVRNAAEKTVRESKERYPYICNAQRKGYLGYFGTRGCLLSYAWARNNELYYVSNHFASENGACWNQEHPFENVVIWFDSFGDGVSACKAVIEMLEKAKEKGLTQ